MEGFEELKLDDPTGEGETRLGLALRTPCLWQKEHIDMSPSYLLFQTLLPLFWTLTCII